ncbi:MAG: SDR family oxidoreductase [Deltaproteobacteria bacterium]|nr:SDR family oxidoreductase [Deltaproteobacteria bacterium]
MKLKNRVAIVTGASRGVGRSVALALAREGCDIALAAKTVEPHPKLPGTLGSVAQEVEALGRKALSIQTDVRFVDQIEAMVEKTVEAFGRVDILINNAGAAWWYNMEETPEKKFDLVMNVNCKGPFFAAQAVLPHMKKNRWGHIVNMSPPIQPEMAGGKIAYMISKFGMTLLTHGLAKEAAGSNIAVNSLWPVTLIESLATINLGLGTPENWRKADILADATVAIVTKEPRSRSGQALFDEDVLREEGIKNFDHYACVPGSTPMVIPW